MSESILSFMPASLQRVLRLVWGQVEPELEEVRIRAERPLELRLSGGSRFVCEDGRLAAQPGDAYRASATDCTGVLELLTNHSAYSFEEQLKLGYITIPGGHRVGLAGRAVLEAGRVRLLKDVSSFNFRIAKAFAGAATPFLPYLIDDSAGGPTIHHTLIVSPPQHGKTTLARDLARLLSASCGLKVGVVDERSELAACVNGIPRFDLGPRTDVLDGCPKAEGMMMMIRSMSPQVLVVDELGRPEDASAVREAIHAGIRIAATAHGAGPDDIRSRPALRELLSEGAFRRIVTLRRDAGGLPYGTVWDEQGRKLSPPLAAIPPAAAAAVRSSVRGGAEP